MSKKSLLEVDGGTKGLWSEYLIFPELHSPMLQRHILLSLLLQAGQSKIHETDRMRSLSQFRKFV